MADSDRDNSRAVLVGRLIKSYREGRGLTQGGLLDLMVERGESYAINLDRSSIGHWERGARLARREFLVGFGRSLEISEREVDRMLVLAGYDTLSDDDVHAAIDRFQARLDELQRDVQKIRESDADAAPDIQTIKTGLEELQRDIREIRDSDVTPELQSIRAGLEVLQRDVQSLTDSVAASDTPMDMAAVVKDSLQKLALPGVYVAGVGYILDALGFNSSWILLAYVSVALAIVLGQGILRWRRSHEVGELFFISILLTLNTPLLLGAVTKVEHYGFYMIPAFTDTSIPFLFAMMANLALSLTASVIFSVSWNRQYGAKGARSVFSRAVWTGLPPILFVYANIVVFTNLGACIYFMIVFGILFGAFTAIMALNDPKMRLENVGFIFKAAVVAIMLLCSFGVIGTLVGYLEPSMAFAAADYRLMPWREVGPEALGYTQDEGFERIRLGILLMSLSVIMYLAIVVGGYLLITIDRHVNRSGRRQRGYIPNAVHQ